METAKIIPIAGRFDVHRLEELRRATTGARAVVIDASNTEFVDTHALTALAELEEDRRGALAVAAPSLTVRITFELTKSPITTYPTVAEAVADLARAA